MKQINMFDQITLDRISTMHPKVREQLKVDYLECNRKLPRGVRLRFAHCYRSIAEQNELYAQGRTKLGKIVTNAKGGSSIHNYALAFDIVILYDKDNNGTFETASWELDKHFLFVVNFFKEKGWSWGGDWRNFKDNPHFEKTFGKSLAQLKLMPKDNNGYVIF